MRHDSRELVVHADDRNGDAPSERPTLSVHCHGETDAIRTRLTGGGEGLTGNDLDVAFRFQTREGDTATGVLSLADRTTGTFIVEVPTDAEPIVELVRAARQYGDAATTDTTYTIRLLLDNNPVLAAEKRTLLVYSTDGTLLRHHSLIPADVEV